MKLTLATVVSFGLLMAACSAPQGPRVRPVLLGLLDKKARPALLVQLARRVLKACKVLKVKRVPLGQRA